MANLSESDIELLSAYIDDGLTAAERLQLENRLANEEPLRRELAALRQTVALVNALPPRRAPRNYTLTPAMVRPIPPPAVIAPPAPKIVALPPRPTRRLWLPASAAAAVVVAVGFFAVVAGSFLNPEPTAIASAPTNPPFYNQITTGMTDSYPVPLVTPEAETATTSAPKFGETPEILFATTDPNASPYGEDPNQQQSGNGMGGDPLSIQGIGGQGGAPSIDAEVADLAQPALIDTDPQRPGFSVATMIPDAAQTTLAPHGRSSSSWVTLLANLLETIIQWLGGQP